jgi:hypothetical protein
MTDYNKLTVANLRQLLKDRGIPSTGLTRKAQIIEKLEEHDTESNDVLTQDPVGEQEEVDDQQDEAVTSESELRIHVCDVPEA